MVTAREGCAIGAEETAQCLNLKVMYKPHATHADMMVLRLRSRCQTSTTPPSAAAAAGERRGMTLKLRSFLQYYTESNIHPTNNEYGTTQVHDA
jgi:hypothetical protein